MFSTARREAAGRGGHVELLQCLLGFMMGAIVRNGEGGKAGSRKAAIGRNLSRPPPFTTSPTQPNLFLFPLNVLPPGE